MVICANFVYFPALKFLSDYTIILIIKPQRGRETVTQCRPPPAVRFQKGRNFSE